VLDGGKKRITRIRSSHRTEFALPEPNDQVDDPRQALPQPLSKLGSGLTFWTLLVKNEKDDKYA
jgi:hypothetical protein